MPTLSMAALEGCVPGDAAGEAGRQRSRREAPQLDAVHERLTPSSSAGPAGPAGPVRDLRSRTESSITIVT